MSAPIATNRLTAEEFFRLPEAGEGTRRELVKGVIVTMSPTGFYHGLVCTRIGRHLDTFVDQNQLGYVGGNDPGVILERDPDTVRGPDVAFWRKDRVTNVRQFSYTEVVPDLVVEVLSPNDVFTQVLRKVQEYFSAGVRVVWIVVPEDQGVAIYRPEQNPTLLAVNDTLSGEDVVPGFACPVAQLFP